MICIDSIVLNYIGISYFIFFIFICWLFGRSKHNVLVHENNFIITLLLNLTCIWYFSASYGGFCWASWERDDGVFTIPLYQFAIGATLTIVYSQIISLRPKSGALTVLTHFIWCLVYNIMFLQGTLAFKKTHRVFWIASSIVLAIFSFYHIIKDSKVGYSNKPQMVKYLLFVFAFYQFFNFSIHLWSPYQEYMIGFFLTELFFLMNTIISCTLISFLVLQYGKGLYHTPRSKLFNPNFVLNANSNNSILLRHQFHLRNSN